MVPDLGLRVRAVGLRVLIGRRRVEDSGYVGGPVS